MTELAVKGSTQAAVPEPPHTATSADLALALRLAGCADAITLDRFLAADLQVTSKPDRTPVTDADTAVEDALRTVLGRERPGDAVLGEEGGEEEVAGNGRGWVLDPIDGTKNFSRGLPVWATLIGLTIDGQPVLGVVSAPALNRRWWAEIGQGAWTSTSDAVPRRLVVSGVADLADAYLSTTDFRDFGDDRDRWLTLADNCAQVRVYVDFWQHMLVAEGALDVAAEASIGGSWDAAALVPILREAGGRVTDFAGADPLIGRTLLSTNGALHDQALHLLTGPRSRPPRGPADLLPAYTALGPVAGGSPG